MRYCPTCGYEVSESQRFCPECSTKLTGASASTSEPPADVSNAVPRRPGGGWALQDDGASGDIDDFFSSYRRKTGEASSRTESTGEALPTRRSRRRFDPDLSYDSTPLPAAPQPEAPKPAVSGPSAAAQLPFIADAGDEQARLEELNAEVEATRPARPSMLDDHGTAPKPAAPIANDPAAHWFEELDQSSPAASQPGPEAPQPQFQNPAPHEDESPTVRMPAVQPRPAQQPAQPSVQRPTPGPQHPSASASPQQQGAPAVPPQRPAAPFAPQTPATPEPPRASDTPERAFDEVLTGREPGDETMDHPIISRDFDRTGIVHVPRLDDGRPVAPSAPAADAVDAPWRAPQTGLNPAVAPLPEQGGWPAAGAPSPFDSERGTGLGDLVRDNRPPAQTGPGASFGPAATSQHPVVGDQRPPQGEPVAAAAGGQADPARSIFAEWFGGEDAQSQQPDTGAARAPVEFGDTLGGPVEEATPAASTETAAPGTDAPGSTSDDEWAGVLFSGNDTGPQRAPARPHAEPAPVDPEVERQRPWYEQGLDGTEETGQEPPFWSTSRGAAPAAPASGSRPPAMGQRAAPVAAAAPVYNGPQAPHAPVHSGAAPAGAGADVRASASGGAGGGVPGGPGGPTGSGSGGDDGGMGGAIRGLDRTGKRRLLLIAVAFVGAVLLIVSGFLIGGAIGARDDDQAAPGDTTSETDPAQTDGQSDDPAEPVPPPPPVADPNFEAVAFQSESANLRCVISPEYGVACQHSNPAFEVPAEVCAETGTAGAVVGLDSNGVTYPCLTEDIPYGQETLPMDTPITAGEFTCRITLEFGVNCENASGDGIGLEFELGISTAGRASETPQQPVSLPEIAY